MIVLHFRISLSHSLLRFPLKVLIQKFSICSAEIRLFVGQKSFVSDVFSHSFILARRKWKFPRGIFCSCRSNSLVFSASLFSLSLSLTHIHTPLSLSFSLFLSHKYTHHSLSLSLSFFHINIRTHTLPSLSLALLTSRIYLTTYLPCILFNAVFRTAFFLVRL